MKKILLLALLMTGVAQAQTPTYYEFPEDELTASAATPLLDLYSSAIAFYTFNDNWNLGYEGGDTSEPVATLATADSSYASVADVASLDPVAGESFGFVAWIRPSALSGSSAFVAKGDGADAGEYEGYVTSTGAVICRLHDGAGTQLDSSPLAAVAAGGKSMVACRYDASANELEASYDNTWTGTPASTAADSVDTAAEFSVGRREGGLSYFDGEIGPVLFYKATGAQVLTDTITSALWNGGKGKTCSQLSASDKVGLVSCWDMTEAPGVGTYSDTIGSNTLTAVNGPIAQGAGLVRTGSGNSDLDLTPVNTPTATGGATGYAAMFNDATSQYANGPDMLVPGSGVSLGILCWARMNDLTVEAWMGKADDMGDEGEFDSYLDGTSLYARFHDGVGVKTDSVAHGLSAGDRAFLQFRYDATANAIEGGINGSWSGSPTSTAGDGTNTAHTLKVGANGAAAFAHMSVSSCVAYRSTSGGEVPSDAITTSLYNSGKGKTCGELTAAEQVNLVSCWDMDEDGGPYEDSVSPGYIWKVTAGSSWNSGAVSSAPVAAVDGGASYTAVAPGGGASWGAFGLTTNTAITSFDDITFAVVQISTGTLNAYYDGVEVALGIDTVTTGEEVEVAIEDGSVVLKVEGSTVYTWSESPSFPLYVGVSPYQGGTSVYRTTISEWTNKTGTATGANPLTGVNTPTQAAALVEQPASGMGTWLESASSQYLDTSEAALGITGDMSACAWVAPTSVTGAKAVVGKVDGTDGYFLFHNNGLVTAQIKNGGVVGSATVSGALVVNEWAHLCMTLDDGVALHAYKNGVAGTPDVPSALLTASAGQFAIGSYSGAAVYEFDGAIDEASLWPYTLTPNQIEELYAAGEGKFY